MPEATELVTMVFVRKSPWIFWFNWKKNKKMKTIICQHKCIWASITADCLQWYAVMAWTYLVWKPCRGGALGRIDKPPFTSSIPSITTNSKQAKREGWHRPISCREKRIYRRYFCTYIQRSSEITRCSIRSTVKMPLANGDGAVSSLSGGANGEGGGGFGLAYASWSITPTTTLQRPTSGIQLRAMLDSRNKLTSSRIVARIPLLPVQMASTLSSQNRTCMCRCSDYPSAGNMLKQQVQVKDLQAD